MSEPLRGGRTTQGVVREGDSVRRPRDHRSAFAARAVTTLHGLGMPWVPAYLGIDEEGRDTFAFVEGTTTDHPTQRDERSYGAIGRILHELHAVTAGTAVAAGGRCLVHGDPGPFNTIMRDGMPVALIDWDSVHPGEPAEDIGYASWTWCVQSGAGVPIAAQARRLRSFRDGYDPALTAAALLAAIDAAQDGVIAAESSVLDDPGSPPARRAHAESAIRWALGDQRLCRDHRSTFEQALAG